MTSGVDAVGNTSNRSVESGTIAQLATNDGAHALRISKYGGRQDGVRGFDTGSEFAWRSRAAAERWQCWTQLMMASFAISRVKMLEHRLRPDLDSSFMSCLQLSQLI
jgi:hypothetical protein